MAEGRAMGLDVRLLGDIEVEVEGRPVRLGGTRAESLFVSLVLNRGRTVGVEALVDRLWPDEPPLAADKALQVHVSRLRRVLGSEGGRITWSSGGYSLRLSEGELDSARFSPC
jgi:DNA-binding SARP family transcriptional activator